MHWRNQLAARGWPALPYHAGLETAARSRHQRRFTHEEGIIIVATIAFGMGIDKSNVRFILHYNLPKNLESYYQQIGRAGRDGLQADCLLLFSARDVQTINYFINEQEPSQRPGAAQRLQAMLGFCRNKSSAAASLYSLISARRTTKPPVICATTARRPKTKKHWMNSPFRRKNSSPVSNAPANCLACHHIIDVLRGSRSQKVLSRNHDQLSTYDIGREFSKKEWQFLARQFIQQA